MAALKLQQIIAVIFNVAAPKIYTQWFVAEKLRLFFIRSQFNTVTNASFKPSLLGKDKEYSYF